MKKLVIYIPLLALFLAGCQKIKFNENTLAGNWKFSEFHFIHFKDTITLDTTIHESGYFNFSANASQFFIGGGKAKIPLFYDVWNPAFFNFRPSMYEGDFTLQRSGAEDVEKYNNRNAYQTTMDVAQTQRYIKFQLIDKNHLVIIIPYSSDAKPDDPDNFIYTRINLTK